MNDVLAVVIGLVLGVLASVPLAFLIVAIEKRSGLLRQR